MLARSFGAGSGSSHSASHELSQTLVSYSYFESDAVQQSNMEFFLSVGMGLSGRGKTFKRPHNTHFVFVISGENCTPCKKLYAQLGKEELVSDGDDMLSGAWSGQGVTVLKKKENIGMDFAGHNATIGWLHKTGTYPSYKYFIFLNSSVKGPFNPIYMPGSWQWTMAYTDPLKGDVKAVGATIVCLPASDGGGLGPKIESFAYSVDSEGLEIIVETGVFHVRECKLCIDGVVILGEYGISKAILAKGFNIASLMSKYGKGIDWRDKRHWHCNNNVHPSREGSYDGISMHPFETLFVKTSWGVGEPFVSRYSGWFDALADGQDTTTFNLARR